MKESIYNIIIKTLFIICFITMTVVMTYVGCRGNNQFMNHYEIYNSLKEQYDTTTQYNRMVLYPQIKACGDSILRE